ncbi:MAG: transposase [Bacteroidia bacterium]|nr:transposase [Bacteroidia bacterium]
MGTREAVNKAREWRNGCIQKALSEIEGGSTIAAAAKRHSLSYSTLYLHYRKTTGATAKTRSEKTLGRKKKYTDEVIIKCIESCISGMPIKEVARTYGVCESTLRTYLSLYKTHNENIKCMLVRLKKIKGNVNTEPPKPVETKEPKQDGVKTKLTVPFSYTIEQGELTIEYTENIGEVTKETYFDFIIKDGVLCMNLRGFVIFFGNRENIVYNLFNTLSDETKIPEDANLFKDPYREYFMKRYFPVSKVLECAKTLRIRYYYAEQLAEIYKFIKEHCYTIEQLITSSLH